MLIPFQKQYFYSYFYLIIMKFTQLYYIVLNYLKNNLI